MRRRDPYYYESSDGDLERLLTICLDRGIPAPQIERERVLEYRADGEVVVCREVVALKFHEEKGSLPQPPQTATALRPKIKEAVAVEIAKEMAKAMSKGALAIVTIVLLWFAYLLVGL